MPDIPPGSPDVVLPVPLSEEPAMGSPDPADAAEPAADPPA